MIRGVLLLIAVVLSGALAPTQAQIAGFPPGTFQSRAPIDAAGGGGGTCTQGTNALANTSLVSGSTYNNIMTAICGMVTDGTYASLDLLFLFATDSAADAKVNLANSGSNTANNLVTSGSCTFTINQGFTGDASTCVGDPSYIPSTSPTMTANSVSLGACVLNSRSTPQNYMAIGGDNGTQYVYIQPLIAGPEFTYEVNGFSFPVVVEANAQGSWIASRTASNATAAYLNGASIGTTGNATFGNLNQKIFVFAFQDNTTTNDFTADQLGYVFAGGGLTSGQATNVYNRLHTFMAAQGNSAC